MSKIRFIDSSYNALFYLADGENLLITRMEGSTFTRQCRAYHSDPYHFWLGNEVMHICQFAELCQWNGYVYAPEKPQPGDCLDTYEIYQSEEVQAYMPLSDEAGEACPDAAQYRLMYRNVLAPKTTLEDLFAIHNGDRRPFGDRMRSLSVSDVIVTNRGGKAVAWLVQPVGFKLMPGIAEALKKQNGK